MPQEDDKSFLEAPRNPKEEEGLRILKDFLDTKKAFERQIFRSAIDGMPIISPELPGDSPIPIMPPTEEELLLEYFRRIA